MTAFEYQENKIKQLLSDMSSIYADMVTKEELSSSSLDNDGLKTEISHLKYQFKHLADNTYKLCLVYFETKCLSEYFRIFETDLSPMIRDSNKLFSGAFNQDNTGTSSDLVTKFWSYLLPFPAFGEI
jgi:hypothetical protein